jgi:hypothetical protein
VWLQTLPGLVLCGGRTRGEIVTSDVWRLDLATLRWAPMPALVEACRGHACCVVRGSLVTLGGRYGSGDASYASASVQMLSPEAGEFVSLPPLSCGAIAWSSVLAVDESDSAQGQVLLLGGWNGDSYDRVITIHLVDLTTGECTPQSPPDILDSVMAPAAARLPDGRVTFFGYNVNAGMLVSVLQQPEQADLEHVWMRKPLPKPNLFLGHSSRGCVLNDGRLAMLGGRPWIYFEGRPGPSNYLVSLPCEALTIGVDGASHWDPLPPMRTAIPHYFGGGRHYFACEAVAGCVIIAGGQSSSYDYQLRSVEVYEEALGRWWRLPCNLPDELSEMASALL